MEIAIGAALISTALRPLVDLAMGKVQTMVVDKVAGIVKIKRDISELQTTLSMIEGILQVAEKMQIDNELKEDQVSFIQNWLRDLVDIAYEARDVLDDFITYSSFTPSKQVKFISSLYNRSQLAKDIKSVTKRFDKKKKVGDTFATLRNVVVGGGSESVVVNRRRTEGPSRNKQSDYKFVEREDVKEKILHPSEDNRVHVVAIWGMGGIGKTTLARSIYNDERVKTVPRRWLSVGVNKFSAEKVIREIVNVPNTTGIGNLDAKLQKELSGDRFLIVLDDVWDVDGSQWDLLFNPLTEVGKGGLIIITTRKREVCTATNTQETYDLKPLSKEDSWSIFESCAYLNGKSDSTPDLKDIGKKIVKKLNGHPLALKVVGCSLKDKDSSTWTNFQESNDWMLTDDDDDNDNNIMSVLRWSYKLLPPRLKLCFVYCALFPKGRLLDEKVLVEMWMAHDLIQINKDRRPEEIGTEYFNKLTRASLIQCVDKRYVMHDMIHDLAVHVSNEEFSSAVGSLSTDQMKKVRHITITDDVGYSKNLSLCKSKRILTVYTPYKWKWHERSILEKDILREVFKQSKSLRVLVLSNEHISEIPDCISDLRHLRYLDVSGTSVKILPDSLCDLYNLQMLAAPLDAKLPRDLVKMINLRHVRANLSTCKGVGKLTSLQELSSIHVSKGDNIRELGDLQRLRGKLRIKGLENVEKLEDDVGALMEKQLEDDVGALMEKQTLMDELELIFDKENLKNTTISKKVLNALGCPPNLKCLDIIVNTSIQRRYKLRAKTWWKQNVCEGDNIREPGDVQRLRGKLRMIDHVNNKKLEDAAGALMDKQTLMDKLELEFDVKEVKNFYEEVLDALGCPPNLTYLKIVGYNGLKPPSWMVDGKHKFDKLQTLELSNCRNLESLPALGELTSLKHICLNDVGVKRLGDEFYGKFTDGKVFFPSLESLSFIEMKEWEEWSVIIIDNSSVSFFPRLTELKIKSCAKLVSVLPVVKNRTQTLELSSLKILSIMSCRQLQSLPLDFHELSSLKKLYIYNCPQLQSLPPDLHELSSLKKLYIYDCPQLQSLPPGLHELSSLKELDIYECPRVKSLCLPPSLTHLGIIGCPLLYEHCKDESGPDWHKINHIPDKNIVN